MTRWLLLWVVSLVVVATVAFAQGRRRIEPQIVSGNDLGFRVEGTNPKGNPYGTFVLRINGNWVEVGSGLFPVPAK